MLGRAACLALAAIVGLLACSSPATVGPAPGETPLTVEAGAATWRPLVVSDMAALPDPAPETARQAADLAEVKAWLGRLTAGERETVAYWNSQPAPVRWSETARDMTIEAGLVPPRAARTLAMAHTAIYDATLAVWAAKARHRRAAPARLDPTLQPVLPEEVGVPSYPSEHAAIAYAAATALAEVFPEQRNDLLGRARAAAESRIAAGANLRGDVIAGQAIGEAVAAQVVARAREDGSSVKPSLPLAVQPGQWTHTGPMEPLAGSWRPWLLTDPAAYSLPRPPFPGEPGFQAGLDEVETVGRNLTAEQKAIALKWNLDAPAAQWNDIIRPLVRAHGLNTPRAARVLGYAHALMADTFITTWRNKYQILLPRPNMADPNFKSFVMTPPHPSYPSGHSSCSMAAAAYLSAVFPEEAARVRAMAEEAAESRLYGGIHYRRDNEDGKQLGQRIAEAALLRARADGLP
ncbi:MAG: phosphatase PAP2 family protein [Candidatus Sericytochromatia bacterium]|nr:phosphatase PAP2 family protein [Candidatus Sericytochromatia bacterium]